ncbi:hypothetical protein PilKf_02595 [Pillotina sp. SPG140]|jgi:hypothetical protein
MNKALRDYLYKQIFPDREWKGKEMKELRLGSGGGEQWVYSL